MTIEFLPHTADIQFRIKSKKLEKLFIESSKALKKSFIRKRVKSKIEKKIKVKGKDLENLLYNYLEEFLILFDSENFIFSKIKEIKIDAEKFELTAIVRGDSSLNYDFYSHIKAITYNEMKVERKGSKWIALVTLDV